MWASSRAAIKVWRSCCLYGEGFLVIEDAETETCGRIKPSQIIVSLRTRLGMSVTDEIMKLKREIKNLKKEINSLTNKK